MLRVTNLVNFILIRSPIFKMTKPFCSILLDEVFFVLSSVFMFLGDGESSDATDGHEHDERDDGGWGRESVWGSTSDAPVENGAQGEGGAPDMSQILQM